MISRIVFGSALLAGLCASAAVPTVSNVTTTQDAARNVTVSYTLSGAAGIVIVSAQTNRGDNVWVDVDDAALTFVSGDVNKVVEPGSRSLVWRPHKSWPDHFITGGNIRIGVKAWAKDAPPDYMVVSLVTSKDVRFFSSASAVPGGVQDDKYKTDYMVFRKIPAAGVRWRMGSPTTELGRNANAEIQHEVELDYDYYIGIYPVTQAHWERVNGSRPSYFQSADYKMRPVENITWGEVRGNAGDGYNWPSNGHAVVWWSFMGNLRTRTGINTFDLPTESQWEYAARAGCGSAYYDGTEPEGTTTSANLARLGRVWWNGGQPGGTSVTPAATCLASEGGTPIVGSYEPNAWGLYDMLGTAWEWCLDWYATATTYGINGPTTGNNRVLRGGTWCNSTPAKGRCANRASDKPGSRFKDYSCRVVCPAAEVVP